MPEDPAEPSRASPTRRRRVLMLATLFPPIPYGASKLAAQQACLLAEHFDVRVLAPWPVGAATSRQGSAPDAMDVRLSRAGVSVRRFHALRRPIVRVLPFLFQAAREVASFRPDLIYVPWYRAMGPVAMLLSRLGRAPLVAYLHGSELLQERGRTGREALLRAYLRASAARLVNSRFTAALVREIAADGREAEIVPPPLMPEWLEDATAAGEAAGWRDDLGAGPGARLVVLTVGAVARAKGHDLMLEALEHLAANDPALAARVEWWVVGDGPDLAEFEARARRLLGRDAVARLERTSRASPDPPFLASTGMRAVFFGLREESVVRALMGACDLYAMPTRFDSFGMVFLEAAAMGRPSLATRVGGVADAVADGEGGVLVRPDDSSALAEALDGLLRDDAWRGRLGSEARRRAVRDFSGETIGALLREKMAATLGA